MEAAKVMSLQLTSQERDLYAYLAARRGVVIERRVLAKASGLPEFYTQHHSISRALDVRISVLRKKIKAEGLCIKAIRGKGYVLDVAQAQ